MNEQQLEVKIYRTWEEMSQIRDRWNDFLFQSSSATVYLTHEWLESWWSAFGESRELFVLSLFEPDGTLIGIAPFYRTSCPEHTGTKLPIRMLCFLGTGKGCDLSTSQSLITRHGYEVASVRQLLRWLSDSRSEWDILNLHCMPAELSLTTLLLQELERNRWFRVEKEEPHTIIKFPDTYETYLKSLSKKMRSELPYEHRRLLRNFKVAIRKVSTEAELPQAIEDLIRLNTQRWQARGKRGSFHSDERRVFIQEMARKFFTKGWLDFWVLDLNDRPAAIEYGFRYGNTFYPQWMALDTEYQAYSAGYVLKSFIIQDLIRDSIRIYDYMDGKEPYKMRWGVEMLKYKTLFCAAPYSRGSLYLRMSVMKKTGIRGYYPIRSRCSNYLNSVLPAWAFGFLKGVYRRLCFRKG